MKIIDFKERNVIYAKDQPEYRPLPAFKKSDGEIVTCWRPSIMGRIGILITGKIWLSVLTFNNPLQPLLMSSKKPKMGKDK